MRSKQIGPMLDLCFLRGGQYPKIGIPRVNIPKDVENSGGNHGNRLPMVDVY